MCPTVAFVELRYARRLVYTSSRDPASRRSRLSCVTDQLRPLAQSRLVFNAPLSETRAAALVDRLPIAPGRHVLDLGCGWAELLLRIVAARPGSTGTGVDLDRAALNRGRARAAELGLLDRVDLVEADASTFDDRGDVVLSVGAAHAWGGTDAALAALRDHLEPGGFLLFGGGFWTSEPAAALTETFGNLPSGLDGVVRSAWTAGLSALHADAASLEEWDAFEAGWRSGLEQSAIPGALELAVARKGEYERGYRGVLGFAYLVLRE
jgi:SAM-dependent methyltransferase